MRNTNIHGIQSHPRNEKNEAKKGSNFCQMSKKVNDDQNGKYNVYEQVAKIEQALSQSAREQQQSHNSRFAIFSKLKVQPNYCLNWTHKNKRKNNTPTQQNADKTNQIMEEKRKKKRKQDQDEKIIQEESGKLNKMASGLEEFDSSRRRNLLEHIIFSKGFKKVEKEGELKERDSGMQQRKQIEQALNQRESKNRKLSQLLSHQLQRQQLIFHKSQPQSPQKPRQTHQPKHSQMLKIARSIENRFKRATDPRNGELDWQMKEICEQVRNREKVLNNYFKKIGGEFSFKYKQEGKENVDMGAMKNQIQKIKRCTSRFNIPKCVESLNMSPEKDKQRKRRENKNSGSIPIILLNNIQCFYSSSRGTSQNFNPKLSEKRLKLNLNLISPTSAQFCDQKIVSDNIKTLKSADRSLIERKDLHICQKINCMEKQRKRIQNLSKRSPRNGHNQLSNQFSSALNSSKALNKIIEYF